MADDTRTPPAAGLPQATSLTLLERIKANDGSAWDRLVGLYRPLVCYWCTSAGLRSSDADDVAQDVFTAAFTSLHTFRKEKPGDTFRGWLRTIARRTIGRSFQARSNNVEAGGGTDVQLLLNEVPDVDLPDDDPQSERQALYWRALESVREEFEVRTWSMFWRTVVEEKAPQDVAVEFGATAAVVRKAKSRVLQRLRQEVGDAVD